jgi:hypothetical protein
MPIQQYYAPFLLRVSTFVLPSTLQYLPKPFVSISAGTDLRLESGVKPCRHGLVDPTVSIRPPEIYDACRNNKSFCFSLTIASDDPYECRQKGEQIGKLRSNIGVFQWKGCDDIKEEKFIFRFFIACLRHAHLTSTHTYCRTRCSCIYGSTTLHYGKCDLQYNGEIGIRGSYCTIRTSLTMFRFA